MSRITTKPWYKTSFRSHDKDAFLVYTDARLERYYEVDFFPFLQTCYIQWQGDAMQLRMLEMTAGCWVVESWNIDKEKHFWSSYYIIIYSKMEARFFCDHDGIKWYWKKMSFVLKVDSSRKPLRAVSELTSAHGKLSAIILPDASLVNSFENLIHKT